MMSHSIESDYCQMYFRVSHYLFTERAVVAHNLFPFFDFIRKRDVSGTMAELPASRS